MVGVVRSLGDWILPSEDILGLVEESRFRCSLCRSAKTGMVVSGGANPAFQRGILLRSPECCNLEAGGVGSH